MKYDPLPQTPPGFDIPNCLARIVASDEFRKAAAEVGGDELHRAVEAALKAHVRENADAHLKSFEKAIAERALDTAKHELGLALRDAVATEVKRLVVENEARHIEGFESVLVKRAVSDALAKVRSA